MTPATLIAALRKCEHQRGMQEVKVVNRRRLGLSVASEIVLRCTMENRKYLADRIEKRLLAMFEEEYKAGYTTAQAFTIEKYEK